MMAKIWIDITNSSHVLFFEPIIAEFEKKGYEVIVTAFNCQQTIPLLKKKRIQYKEIGKYYKSKIKKLFGVFQRTLLLWKYLRNEKILISMSHGSMYCTLASKLLHIPNVWIMDGDKAVFNIAPAMIFTKKIIVPEIIPKENFVKFGAKKTKIIQYPGLKEEIYLYDFKVRKKNLQKLKLDKNKKIIVMRPEAAHAAYIKKTKVLDGLIRKCQKMKNTQIVMIPRTEEQRKYYKNKFPHLIIPEESIDVPSLIYYSDLVISAGGTMNREAVVLGKAVISIYQEELLTIDKFLIKNNFLKHYLDPSIKDIKNAMNNKKIYKMSKDGRNRILEILFKIIKSYKLK